jgi:hypothetical protein
MQLRRCPKFRTASLKKNSIKLEYKLRILLERQFVITNLENPLGLFTNALYSEHNHKGDLPWIKRKLR